MRQFPAPSVMIARSAMWLLATSLLVACAAKREAYDIPKVRLPEKFAQAPAAIDATASPASSAEASAPAESPSAASGVPQTLAEAASPTAPTAMPAPSSDTAAKPIPASPLGTALPEWWRMLGSEELNRLIDRALANNHDLRIAALRIAQLKARMDIAGADKLPVLTMPVQTETYFPEWGIGNPNSSNSSRNTHQISLRADWRPDLWGETASQYESAEFQLMRATYQRDDMQRIIVARIATDYLEYLSLNDRLRANRQTEKTLKELFESVKARMEIGDATITELEQQRAAGYAVRATIPVLEQQRVLVQNRIAGLVGTVPEELALSGRGMDTVAFPEVLPGVPSTLLLRRPDVRAVEARLLAADADIDVARARLLPPLDLTAQAGYGSLYLASLFSSPTLFWNTVANLSITLFDHGKRDKEVEFAKAVHEEMVETYIRVIYDAVREVDDSLSAIRYLGKQQAEQSIAAESSFRAWNYSQEAYHAGALDYLVVLDTERTYHRHLDDLYRYRMDRYRGLIDLFSALGGGVQMDDKLPGKGNRPAPLPDEVDYGVVLDAVVAGLHPVIPSASDDHMSDSSIRKPRSFALTGTTPAVAQTDGIDWDGDTLRADRKLWLVELFGTFDRSAIVPAWRDLRARFPQLVEGRQLLPHQQDGIEIDEKERRSWYRLFISAFPDRQESEQVCAELRTATLHCGVVSSRSLDDNDPFNAGRTLNESRVITNLISKLALQSLGENTDIETAAPIAPEASGNPEQRQAEPAPSAASPAPAPEDAPPTAATTGHGQTGMFDPADQEFWLVELPPVHDQRAIADAWRNLRDRFPGQMKIRTLLTRQEPGENGKEPQHQLFIARFPEKFMAVEFCGMLHSAMQTCSVLSSRSFSQRDALDASWSTDRSFADRQGKAGWQ